MGDRLRCRVTLAPLTATGRDLENGIIAFGQDATESGILRWPSQASAVPGLLQERIDSREDSWFSVQVLMEQPAGTPRPEWGRGSVGIASIHTVDWWDRNGKLGLWIHPDWRGRGIGAAAHGLLLRHAFEALHLHRVQSLIMSHAMGARSFVEASMLFEGEFRDAHCVGQGRWVTAASFGLTQENWIEGCWSRSAERLVLATAMGVSWADLGVDAGGVRWLRRTDAGYVDAGSAVGSWGVASPAPDTPAARQAAPAEDAAAGRCAHSDVEGICAFCGFVRCDDGKWRHPSECASR